VRVHPNTPAARQLASRTLNSDFNKGDPIPISLNRLPGLLRPLITAHVRAAAVLDYASRVPVSVQQLTEAEYEFFTACEKLAHTAHPIMAAPAGVSLFNLILWRCNRENDLPSWFTA
jgi:hypothetical protein